MARNDSVSAMITTALVSPMSISAGNFERKYSSGENSSVDVSHETNCLIDSILVQISRPTTRPVSVPTRLLEDETVPVIPISA